MSKLQALIEEIEVNEQAIAELEAKAAPACKEQLACAVTAKAARAAGRECQAEADGFLAPAQDLRYKNQQLKLEAGQIALNAAKNAS